MLVLAARTDRPLGELLALPRKGLPQLDLEFSSPAMGTANILAA
jgi:hypothetical protein